MLKKLRKTELKVQLKKFNFYAQKVKFLEFLISHEKVKINKDKIQ